MAEARVRVERDVGDHARLGQRLPDCRHGAAQQVVRVQGDGGARGLERGVDRGEERERLHAQRDCLLTCTDRAINREARASRHGVDGLGAVLAVDQEQRQHEPPRTELGLPDEPAHGRRAPQAPRATDRLREIARLLGGRCGVERSFTFAMLIDRVRSQRGRIVHRDPSFPVTE